MLPSGTGCVGSLWLLRAPGWLQGSADVADSDAQSTPTGEGMSQGGQKPLPAH